MKEGDIAPDFTLFDKDNVEHSLSHFQTKYTVVYFYPRDSTPGCTLQAKAFTDLLPTFKKLDAQIIGISGGTAKTKEKFCDKHNILILLLSDTDFKVAEAYGSYGQKMFMGRTFLGIKRDTYILDENKKVIKIFKNVKAAKNPQEIADFLESLE